MKTLLNRNLVLGLSLVLMALIFAFVLIPSGVIDPGRVDIRVIAPDFFPLLGAFALLAMGAFFTGQGFLNRSLEKTETDDGEIQEERRSLPFLSSTTKPIIVFALLLVYALSIDWLGIVLSSILAFLTASVLGGERRIKIIIPVTIVLPVCLYYFFTLVAGIPLPLGPFEGLF